MEEGNKKLVSIYIPTKNRKKSLEKALKSVLFQTYPHIEIIVVDDASSDDTSKYMQWMQKRYPNIKYIRFDRSKGANAARNRAIIEAKGYYVTGLDDDDVMLPDRIEKLLKIYKPQYAFVASAFYLVKNRSRKYRRLSHKKLIIPNDLYYTNIVGNQVLSTKENFMKAGMFDETLQAAQDYDMWIRLLELTNKALISYEPLQEVYIGHTSITHSVHKRKGYWQLYKKLKHKLSESQRKYWLFNFYYHKKKKISIRNLMLLLPANINFATLCFVKWVYLNLKSV